MNDEGEFTLAVYVERLKQLSRTGWHTSGIPKNLGESIAEHSWGTSFFALRISLEMKRSHESLDFEKVLAMAIIHDLGESITSDIPRSAILRSKVLTDDAKAEAEREAMEIILADENHVHDYLLELHLEMQHRSTLEARIVRAADLLDMMNHAVWLETIGVNSKIVQPFIETSFQSIKEMGISGATRLAEKITRLRE